MLCDHKQVKNVNTHWSGHVSILIYSPLKLIGRVANFLGRPRIYVNKSTLDVTVLRTQLVTDSFFFSSDC
jgi:hypothetical protein